MYMGCCEKNIIHVYTYLFISRGPISPYINLKGSDLTINYFIGGRFDQVILFWGPI